MADKKIDIKGNVKNLQGQGVPNLFLEAYDKDLFWDDALGTATTDQLGHYEIEIKECYRDWLFEHGPDIYFKIYRNPEDPEPSWTTIRSIQWDAELPATINIEVDFPQEEPEPEINHEFKGLLINDETDIPLVGYIVRGFVMDASPETEPLATTVTDDTGKFILTYTTPAETTTVKSETVTPEVQIRLQILTPEGLEIHQVVVLVDQPNYFDIRVALPKEPAQFNFTELESALQIQFPLDLIAFLASQNIVSLDQIRRAGGIRQLQGFPLPVDDPMVVTLEAQAYLTLLSSDLLVNMQLIQQGFTNIAEIAEIPLFTFVSRVQGYIDQSLASRIYQAAIAMMRWLSNILADLRIQLINGSWVQVPDLQQLFETIRTLFPLLCNCPDNVSMVSPIAYLTDLLNYTMAHVKQISNDNFVDLSYLESQFHQPFGCYPMASNQVDLKVRQVRICIEVLRKYLNAQSLSIDPNAYQGYLFEAYRSLLNNIGASYDTFRLARTANNDDRKKLADRLGIRDEHLDELYLEPETVNEQELERLFGLRDTRRDPLIKGIKLLDVFYVIVKWDFNGIVWGKNTDDNGNIYVEITRGLGFESLQVSLYRDRNLNPEQLVATGLTDLSRLRNIVFNEEQNSGLSGYFDMRPIPDSIVDWPITIGFSVISALLSWRWEYLRDMWKLQDWPADSYLSIESNAQEILDDQLPVIDADRIGPDDFRNPFAKVQLTDPDQPYDLWLSRRLWIDGQLKMLQTERENQGLDSVFNLMYADMNYEGVWLSPWPLGVISHNEFEALRKNLERGEQLETTEEIIQKHLKLSIESFTRLVEIKLKDEASEMVTDDEWSEIYSILVQAQKLCFCRTWIEEEMELENKLPSESNHPPVLFSSKYFWVSYSHPEEGIWPPVLVPGKPLIDPDILKLADLPETTTGRTVVNLWRMRREQIDRVFAKLLATQERDGFQEMWMEALGDSSPIAGMTWPGYLSKINEDLFSGDPAREEQAKEAITEQLFMTIEDFNRLMKLKQQLEQNSSNNDLSEDEWDEIYKILTRSHKLRLEYGEWYAEETALWQDQGQNWKYWCMLNAKLPRWRATTEARMLWQRALRMRSEGSIIDPDLIGIKDLKTPFESDLAYDILELRQTWLTTQTDNLINSQSSLFFDWGGQGTGDGLFAAPLGIATDHEGTIFVADSGNHRIQKFDSSGTYLGQWGAEGTDYGQFKSPTAIAISSKCFVYVADTENHRVQKFDTHGGFIMAWGDTSGNQPGEFQAPKGIAINSRTGDIYVADTGNDRIQRFDEKGNYIATIGLSTGHQSGEFLAPQGIVVDSRSGDVYVADTGNHRIQQFNFNGRFLTEWGENGTDSGHFNNPSAITMDLSGYLYVCDSGNNRVQKFDRDGRFFAEWNEWENAGGNFSNPQGLTIDANGNIYLADSGNHRIQKFSLTEGLGTIVSETLGVPMQQMIDLASERKQGDDISSRLDQLSLEQEDFQALLRVYEMQITGNKIFDSDWKEVYWHLVQVKKRRAFAEWQKREKQDGIILSPDFFQVSKEQPAGLSELPSIWQARRDWQDQLNARIDQEKTTAAAVGEAVDACEARTLDFLRDALVNASDATLNDTNVKAKSLSEQLLIDCQGSTCQKTTRISQAITTLQNLILALRTGQSAHQDLDLVMDEKFDREWQWIGSYETWKAAMGVFLYPENVLLPSLRRHKTPAFRDLITALRGNQRLTPQGARNLAKNYADYFNDICSLQVKATCTAETRINRNEDKRPLFYMFGIGGVTNTVYWSVYDSATDNPDYAQTFWEVVPGLENVIDVIGAVPYDNPTEESFIYLFALRHKGSDKEFIFIKYDLENIKALRWEGEPNTLELPEEMDYRAIVKQSNDKYSPLKVAIQLADGRIYIRSLNQRGDDWADGEWKPIVGMRLGSKYVIFALIETVKGDCLIADGKRWNDYGHTFYRILGEYDDGRWREICAGFCVGSFNLSDRVYVFFDSFKDSDAENRFFYKILKFGAVEANSDNVFELSHDNIQTSLDSINEWLFQTSRLDLKEIRVNLSETLGIERGAVYPVLYDFLLSAEYKYEEKVTVIEWFIEKTASAKYDEDILGDWKVVNDLMCLVSSPPLSGLNYILTDAVREGYAHGTKVKWRLSSSDGGKEEWTVEYDCDKHRRFLPTSGTSYCLIYNLLFECIYFVYADSQPFRFIRGFYPFNNKSDVLFEMESRLILPQVTHSLTLSERLSSSQRQDRRQWIKEDFEENEVGLLSPQSNLTCLEEAFYFLPVAFALQLQRGGHYTASLDWFKTVYDYTVSDDPNTPDNERKIYYGLELEKDFENGYKRSMDWLLDPLDVHAIASSRRNTYTRFTLLSIIRCILAYADAEFTRDTAESLPNARMLYEMAFDLLAQSPELQQQFDSCIAMLGDLQVQVDEPNQEAQWKWLLTVMANISDKNVLETTAAAVCQIMQGSGTFAVRIGQVRAVINKVLAERQSLSIADVFTSKQQAFSNIPRILLSNESIETGAITTGFQEETTKNLIVFSKQETISISPSLAFKVAIDFPTVITFPFCIPFNPLIQALRFHVENNLRKLRTCRNIAGVKRVVDPYAVPIDVLSAMPSIGPGGQLVLPTRITSPSVPYRYDFLIDRAKQLARLAAQMEAQFLSLLEKREAELYNLLKAKQDVGLARSGVKLQKLRLRQAEDGVVLAELQRESAAIQCRYYTNWLSKGLLFSELLALSYQFSVSMTTRFIQHASGAAELSRMWSNYERREQQWMLQRDLAQQSILIGEQQIKIADDGVDLTRQEHKISEIQVEHAEQIVEFLHNKETNFELYDWMNDILENIYSYFLQQATAMAKLAQNQLAFERQQPPLGYIMDDYWEIPSEERFGGASEEATDRHGLTGSARLLADIYKLDQYRLETTKRKLQLTKVVALSHIAPFEFQQFKENGILVFATPMEIFDRDFPGHYLRLIKRIRTSVIALIPPTEGIKATLTSIGISRIVVNNEGIFQNRLVTRPPESVALSSATNASGLFELEIQSEMMLPFEGLGVDTTWEFRLPKAANPFDFNTIADILITIEYTALEAYDYRQQVIDSLPSRVSGDRPFSFKHQFVDQWYDLHNPEQTSDNLSMTVIFNTRREDYPANLESLKIQQVLLYFVRASGETFEVKTNLTFKADGEIAALGGEAESTEGVISTRQGNAGSWILLTGQQPVGEWTLMLPKTDFMKKCFKEEKIEDILLVITYSGRTPPWPE